MKLMTAKQVEQATINSAMYYRNSNLYTMLSNSGDAYDFYVNEYLNDMYTIVEEGFSYYLHNDYLFAIRPDVFELQHKDVYDHYFGIIDKHLDYRADMEDANLLHIFALGPTNGMFNGDTVRLINEFVKRYQKDYTIITEAYTTSDKDLFQKQLGCRIVNNGGFEFVRWGRR